MELIINTFDHTSEALAHLSSMAVNISLLAKITYRDMLHTVIRVAARPMVVECARTVPQSTERSENENYRERKALQGGEMVLPRHDMACIVHEPKNGPMRISAVALWLKLKKKYFNSGMVKEACSLFDVTAKKLSQVLTGRKYLGGTQSKDHERKRKVSPKW